MASPSPASWISTSMLKLPDTAACTAPGMFSRMPRARSCRPRWATGRAVNQSGARITRVRSGDFEHAFDFDRRIGWQRRHADGGAGMAALVAEHFDHQVGSAVQNLRPVEKIRRGIDKAAEANDAHHLVEIAERGLELRQQIDGAAARSRVALLNGNAGAELALGDQLALGVDANLTGNDQEIASAHKPDVIGYRAWRRMQDNAKCPQFCFARTRHVASSSDMNSSR